MFRRYLSSVQRHITDPSVLAAVIAAEDYRVERGIQVQPDQAAHIIKQGKSPAAEAIAPVVTDAKLLTKLARDSRKGVRASALKNPNITQDDLELLLRRSLKNDSDLEVAVPAVRLMNTNTLLGVLSEHMGARSTQVYGQPVDYSGLRTPGGTSYGRQDTSGASDIVYELCRRITDGGVEYLRKLHEIGFQDYAFNTDAMFHEGEHIRWFQPGMLTWMVPEMSQDLVPLFLSRLLQSRNILSLEDVHAAEDAIRESRTTSLMNQCDPNHGSRATSGAVSSKLDDDTLRAVYSLGPYWQRVLRSAPRLPEDLQLKFVSELSAEELAMYKPADVPEAFLPWEPTNDADASDVPDYNWQSPDAVNIIAERWGRHLLSEAVRTSSEVQPYEYGAVNVAGFVQAVHPDRRKALSPMALMLASWNTSNAGFRDTGYGGFRRGELGTTPIRDWLQGNLDDKPTPEMITELVEFTQKTRGDRLAAAFLEIVSSARRVSLLLGGALDKANMEPSSGSGVTYLVFQHFFGNNPEGWTVALELGQDWTDSLEELAVTTCAAAGIELPDEVLDLADLDQPAGESDEDISEGVDPEQSDENVPDDADTDEAEVSDPAPAESSTDDTTEAPDEATEVPEDAEAEDSDADDEEVNVEDITSLDITTPVMYTLF